MVARSVVFAGIALAVLAGPVAAETVYRCVIRGTVTFSGHPCGPHARRIEVPDNHIGGRFDTNLPPPEPESRAGTKPESVTQQPAGECPAGYINSTELNSLRIDRKVYPGMSEEQVRAILGPPDHINKEGWWVYMYQYWVTGRYLFIDGCLKVAE